MVRQINNTQLFEGDIRRRNTRRPELLRSTENKVDADSLHLGLLPRESTAVVSVLLGKELINGEKFCSSMRASGGVSNLVLRVQEIQATIRSFRSHKLEPRRTHVSGTIAVAALYYSAVLTEYLEENTGIIL